VGGRKEWGEREEENARGRKSGEMKEERDVGKRERERERDVGKRET
jgi:hypothetical protein